MITKSKTAKFLAGFVGLAMALSFVVTPVTANAATIAELQAMIASLSAQLSALSATSAVTTGGYTFNTNLTVGSKGADVMNLQKVLNSSADTKLAGTGAGSPGLETSTFGPATKAAVMKFQTKYGISPVAGFVGSITRAKLNTMGGAVVVVPPPVTIGLPTGGALTVFAGAQPANSLAPQNASRVAFTTVVLTAGSADVTVNSITVERVGLGQSTVFAGVVLLDSAGLQIGIAKTLNSNHQAMVGEPWVIKAGTSMTVTVAGNIAADNSTRAGQVVGLNVVAINTSASVSGSLPISGAMHTVNATLSLGTATLLLASNDPNSTSLTKEIGTTGYTFAGVKVTAGSVEQVRLWSVRWNQSGSASSQDLSNVKVFVDGTSYDTTVSSDGKYYSAVFTGGLLIDKGLSKEVSIKGDFTGTGSSSRTVQFDLYKNTDLYMSGVTYGYGIIATASGNCNAVASTATDASEFINSSISCASSGTIGTPFLSASKVTIAAGSATSISKANTVAAQNIAVNVSNQNLGGFTTEIKGEPITVQSMVFAFATTGTWTSSTGITNITLVDSNGAVVAGPVDQAVTCTTTCTITFTDSVTFPVGLRTYTVKGRIPSGAPSGATVIVSTTPSSQWTTVSGATTGTTITLTNALVTMNTMTVKAGDLAMSVSPQPTARTVIAGSQGFEYARYVLDAGQSGEDVRLANFKALLALGTIIASQVSSCNLFDGATNLTNGTSVTLASGDNTFTFNDGGYVVPKGTSKTLSMKCNLSTAATSGTVTWGLTDNSSTYTAATGFPSGLTIAETMTAAAGQLMTAGTSGSYTVTNDSALLYKVAQAGAAGTELARFRFTAGGTEAVDLKQIALILGNNASNSPADLVNTSVTLWNGATQIGTAQFGGANPDHATSTTLSPAPRIAAGESVLITVKGDLSAQNVNEGTPGAALTVNYNGDNNGTNGNFGTGVDSQVSVSGATTGEVASNGIRIFRTVPVIAVAAQSGALAPGNDLYKFTVTNPNSRDVVFQKFSFSVATTGGATTGFTLYGDSVAANAVVVNQIGSDGSSAILEVLIGETSQAKIVSANSSKTYILRAATVVDTASVAETINLALLADTSYPSLATLMGTVTSVEAGSANTDNIIWSPFSTTTPVATSATQSNLDWTNGFGLPGFPANAAFPTQTWTRPN